MNTKYVIKYSNFMKTQFTFCHIRDRKCLSVEMLRFLIFWALLVSIWVAQKYISQACTCDSHCTTLYLV